MRLFDSVAGARNAIVEVGLERRSDQLLSLLRPTVRYVADAAPQVQMATGASRIGGTPDLPRTWSWPKRPAYADADVRNIEIRDPPAVALRGNDYQERNRRQSQLINRDAFLPFLAQIDLADAWREQNFDIDLPRAGRLLFFYDARECPPGFDPADLAGFRVIWDDTPVSDLVHTIGPEELAIDYLVVPAKVLRAAAGYILPELEAFACRALSLPCPDRERYDRLLHPYDEQIGTDGWYDRLPDIEKQPHHFLNGCDDSETGRMELECELVTRGIPTGGPNAFTGEEADFARLRQADWCLIAKFDCSEFTTIHMEHEWFTDHKLYFWIRRDDLSARRFERAWVLART